VRSPGSVGGLGPFALVLILAGCGAAYSGTIMPPTSTASASGTAPAVTASAHPRTQPTPAPWHFASEVFAALGDAPVSDALGAELQGVLEASANGVGLTATVIGPSGTWSGATGMATAEREMVPDDQMSIGHVTQTIVAAQVMKLVEAGELRLDDLAGDFLPPGLEFDTNGATIADLLSHRSGLPETLDGPGEWESLPTDPLRAWTPEEVLPERLERGPVGRAWEFTGTNYTLLGVLIEQATGRSMAELLRSGVLAGHGYDRLIYQPDERPTEPMAMPSGAAAATFDQVGGYLPSLAKVTGEITEANMASDAPTLAHWWKAFCAGEIVSQASLDEMTDFGKRPEYGLGIWDRQAEYSSSGALGHIGESFGFGSMALCFPESGTVVVVLANAAEHDVGTTAGNLWRATGN
jgi:D-alanyl-D-alanine carboxypeptidase